MSTYLISDIHGYNSAFRKALKKVRLKKTDTLIILGDLIDRGPDSKGVLDTIFLLKEHDFNIVCIRGNHEEMLIDSLDDITNKVKWIRNGGEKTLESFLTSRVEKIPNKYIDFLKSLPYYYIKDDYIFVHAGVNMKSEKPLEDKKSLLWLRDWEQYYDSDWIKKRKVYHGHTPQTQSEIKKQHTLHSNKGVYGIDNGIFIKNNDGFGSLCIVNLDNNKIHFENK